MRLTIAGLGIAAVPIYIDSGSALKYSGPTTLPPLAFVFGSSAGRVWSRRLLRSTAEGDGSRLWGATARETTLSNGTVRSDSSFLPVAEEAGESDATSWTYAEVTGDRFIANCGGMLRSSRTTSSQTPAPSATKTATLGSSPSHHR